MTYIILSANEAAAVAGFNEARTAMLSPIPLASGAFALPSSVLDDPEHAAVHDVLAALPVRALEDDERLRGDE